MLTHAAQADHGLPEAVAGVLANFVRWLDGFGETSLDHQTFFSGPVGGSAKALYYRRPALGMAAVAPMIVVRSVSPVGAPLLRRSDPLSDRRRALRDGLCIPLRDDGEARATSAPRRTSCSELEKSRCADFQEYCWGYPFDWVTRNGTIRKQTPLITSTPYAYEAFLQLFSLDPRDEWLQVLKSIARHATTDIKDFRTSETASSCSYTPFDTGGVINAAAYRAFLLTSASEVLDNEQYRQIADRNLQFVLDNQNPDGSWYYAVDGVRDFVDHFHTCFVMKALAKIHTLTGDEACHEALGAGRSSTTSRKPVRRRRPAEAVFAGAAPDGLQARALRLRRMPSICASCSATGFPSATPTLDTVVAGILKDWVKPDGSFRSRQLFFGWDNVPMHRWAQSQMFRSLAFYSHEKTLAAAV